MIKFHFGKTKVAHALKKYGVTLIPLMKNGDYMDDKKAYDEGFRSFKKNYGALKNPYPRGTDQCNSFERGWIQAHRRASNEQLAYYEKLRASRDNNRERRKKEELEARKRAYKARKE